jgi:LysR family glycine cleavage system transcriptional activator
MLVAADLAAGRLVQPFKHTLKAVSSFYVVYPAEAFRRRKVRIFRDWLFSEIKQQQREI